MARFGDMQDLQAVFESGAQWSIIRQAATGMSQAALSGWIGERFTGLQPAMITDLAAYAFQAASNRGELVEPSDEMAGYPVAQIGDVPVSPYLFGGSPSGRRFRVNVEVHGGPNDRATMFSLDYATMPSLDELFQAVADLIDGLQHDYPGRFAQLGWSEIEELGIEIIGIQRRF